MRSYRHKNGGSLYKTRCRKWLYEAIFACHGFIVAPKVAPNRSGTPAPGHLRGLAPGAYFADEGSWLGARVLGMGARQRRTSAPGAFDCRLRRVFSPSARPRAFRREGAADFRGIPSGGGCRQPQGQVRKPPAQRRAAKPQQFAGQPALLAGSHQVPGSTFPNASRARGSLFMVV